MKFHTAFLLIICLLAGNLSASEEVIFLTYLQTTTIKSRAIGSDATEDVTACFTFSPIAMNQKLSDVYIEYEGKKDFVPQGNIAHHPGIIIESARVSGEAGYDKHPWIYLSFTLKENSQKRFYIAFQDGKFVKTFVR